MCEYCLHDTDDEDGVPHFAASGRTLTKAFLFALAWILPESGYAGIRGSGA